MPTNPPRTSPPAIEQPAPGVIRITVPLALNSPDELNCHVIEGPDGVGRTTQITLLKSWLQVRGFGVVETGWTRSALVGPAIDLAKAGHAMNSLTFNLLYTQEVVAESPYQDKVGFDYLKEIYDLEKEIKEKAGRKTDNSTDGMCWNNKTWEQEVSSEFFSYHNNDLASFNTTNASVASDANITFTMSASAPPGALVTLVFDTGVTTLTPLGESPVAPQMLGCAVRVGP